MAPLVNASLEKHEYLSSDAHNQHKKEVVNTSNPSPESRRWKRMWILESQWPTRLSEVMSFRFSEKPGLKN